jgi:hypothetical protein
MHPTTRTPRALRRRSYPPNAHTLHISKKKKVGLFLTMRHPTYVPHCTAFLIPRSSSCICITTSHILKTKATGRGQCSSFHVGCHHHHKERCAPYSLTPPALKVSPTPTLSRPPDLLLPQHATTPTCCWLPQLASAAGEGLMPLSSSSMYSWYHFYFILPSLMMCVHCKSCLDGGTCLVCMSTSLAVSQILFYLFDCCFCIDWDCSVPLHNLITKGYGVILSLDVFGFGLNLRKGGTLKQKPN